MIKQNKAKKKMLVNQALIRSLPSCVYVGFTDYQSAYNKKSIISALRKGIDVLINFNTIITTFISLIRLSIEHSRKEG